MQELNFNIYGFARPSTRAEVSALLDEALRMADELDASIEAMTAFMAKCPAADANHQA